MPTPEAEALTQAHRAAQARRAAALAVLVSRYWEGVSERDLAASGRNFIELVLPLIRSSRAASAGLAVAYATRYRELVAPQLEPVRFTVPKDVLPDRAIQVSLSVTGPVALRRKVDRVKVPVSPTPGPTRVFTVNELAVVRRKAVSQRVQGAAVRHALNAGRDVIMGQAVQSDSAVVGYYRGTRVNPCYFCAMLASRGAVYKGDSFDRSDPRFTGDGTIKVHDSCQCFPVPIYARGEGLPSAVVGFEEQWRSATRGKSGRDAVIAFRRAREGR